MSRNKRKMDYHEHDTPREEAFPDISNVASANECTGLMFTPPLSDGELESYQELSNMEIPGDSHPVKDSIQYKLHRSGNAREAGEAVKSAGGDYSPRHMKE